MSIRKRIDERNITALTPSTQIQRTAPTNQPRTGLLTGDALAKQYGNITYDEDAIRSKFDAATQSEYAMKRKEFANTERQFSDQMYGNQMNSLDTLRKANASAISTGASRGMQAAQELSAILGLQDKGTEGATELAQQRNLLNEKEAAAYTKNIVNALETSNAVKQALGTLGANLYAADTQYDVGLMQQLAQLDANTMNYNAADRAAQAAEIAAKFGMEGQLGSAEFGYEGQMGAAKENRLGMENAAKEQRLGTENAATTHAQATRDAANINYRGVYDTALANIESTRLTAEANKAIAQLQKTPGALEQYQEALAANRPEVAASILVSMGTPIADAQNAVKETMAQAAKIQGGPTTWGELPGKIWAEHLYPWGKMKDQPAPQSFDEFMQMLEAAFGYKGTPPTKNTTKHPATKKSPADWAMDAAYSR